MQNCYKAPRVGDVATSNEKQRKNTLDNQGEDVCLCIICLHKLGYIYFLQTI